MEIQKRMFPNLGNFAVQIGSFVAVANLMVMHACARSRDPACINAGFAPEQIFKHAHSRSLSLFRPLFPRFFFPTNDK